MDSHRLLEINLISAQDLKPPPGQRRMQSYAVAWADPTAKIRTLTDRAGGASPTWNDRFVFRVSNAFLEPDSAAAIDVEIYAVTGWCLPDSLVGTVRFLVGNHRLSDRPIGVPSFAAVGVRRPSGRIHGVLNLGATVLGHVSAVTAEALVGTPAVSYRDLMRAGSALRRRDLPPLLPPPMAEAKKDDRRELQQPLKELNGDVRSDGQKALCWLGFQKRIHLSPSDQNLQELRPKESRWTAQI